MKVDIVKYKRDGGRIIMKGIDIAESRLQKIMVKVD